MKTRSVAVVGTAAAVAALGAAAVATAQDGRAKTAAPVAAPAAAAKRPPAQPGDFDGDGRPDIAASSFQGRIHNKPQGGFITVVPSRKAGLDVAGRQFVSANGLGLTIPREFGGSTDSADFDRDGYADLVISAYEGARGAIVIAHGGPKGVTARKTVLKAPNGKGFVAGDFNGNGWPDLVVTVGRNSYLTFLDVRNRPVAGVRTTVKTSGELYSPVAGDVNGDRRTDLVLMTSRDDGDDLMPDRGLVRFGTAKGLGATKVFATGAKGVAQTSATGDVNGDGRADLVNVNPFNRRQLTVRPGTKTGLGALRVVTLGKQEFGDAVAVRDVNGDGKADVAVGLPETAVGGQHAAGRIAVLYGGKAGLTAKGARTFDKNTPGVPGTARKNDQLGADLALTDLNGDRLADLVVGAPNDSSGRTAEGRVFVLWGARGGIGVKGITTFGTKELGVQGRNARLGGILLH
ncbi:FG-GAP and VCBS repeat-containing protein [Actinomadura hibisca]|uniref:FG-GAP and VCBS repeat-containing protein n=1 Tax=Actinomadura hibisca TaxID=68565 RepID=UPI00082A9DDF|nr:FG-GAP and VCBS repeat-containing protein [Actinomadura hibisca]